MLCANPHSPLIELACCDTVTGAIDLECRINGQAWCKISSGSDCKLYWAKASIAAGEFNLDTTDPSCFGVATLEIWCPGWEPDMPNCDLVGTGLCG